MIPSVSQLWGLLPPRGGSAVLLNDMDHFMNERVHSFTAQLALDPVGVGRNAHPACGDDAETGQRGHVIG